VQDSTVATITNDDSSVAAVTSASTVEGNSGVTPVSLTVSLSEPSSVSTSVSWGNGRREGDGDTVPQGLHRRRRHGDIRTGTDVTDDSASTSVVTRGSRTPSTSR